MEKFLVAGDVAIRVSDSQKGDRVVVLLHGYLENLNVWDDFAKLLAPHFRVISMDLPGHGISEVRGPVHTMGFLADTVREALLQLGVVTCCVIGHSMGGYVALAMAEKHPEMVDHLVLFSSTPNADSPEKKEHREREIAIVESGKKELLARTLPAKGFAAENRARFADEIEDYAELVQLTEDQGITALLRGLMERRDMNEAMRALPMPQLLIFGRKDEYILPSVAEDVARNQPQAQVVWLENSGHNGFIEQPAEALEAILHFLNNN